MVLVLAGAARVALPQSRPETSSDAAAVEALEREVEAAYVNADEAFLEATLRDDFRFSHGTGTVEGKAETMANFAKSGNFVSRTLTSVEAEIHGDLALTVGRIEVRSSRPSEYTICYIRLYERHAGRWQLVSHRTYRQAEGLEETCAPR